MPAAIASGLAANAVLAARVGDHRNDRVVVSGDLAGRTNVDKVVFVPNFFHEVRRRLVDATR
jgi:hypothetical protein